MSVKTRAGDEDASETIGFGDPTALVGLTPVNGSGTAMMSADAAPALDQGISPQWTGSHAFGGQATFNCGIAFKNMASVNAVTDGVAYYVNGGSHCFYQDEQMVGIVRGAMDDPKALITLEYFNQQQGDIANVGKYVVVNSTDAGATASGGDAIAIGSTAAATGTGAIAIGPTGQMTASGNFSIAIGVQGEAGGNDAIAIGGGSVCEGTGAIGIGSGAQATGCDTIALGESAFAKGDSAVAIGISAVATGDSSVALGANTSCSESNAVSVGGRRIVSAGGMSFVPAQADSDTDLSKHIALSQDAGFNVTEDGIHCVLPEGQAFSIYIGGELVWSQGSGVGADLAGTPPGGFVSANDFAIEREQLLAQISRLQEAQQRMADLLSQLSKKFDTGQGPA